ncbi:MAG: 16S rRNA (adenine(1518)-N(6)/adenine(1519)-N(6))-dimethyltransferase RsmA [Defluviitaleaceae bacterium]|nr:16S rRNA (adenine(1518)-N(6)/adenine(1519)-N(6))-dimethyltransferase RsmA [Defluviitaleaceae bacterium]
MPTTKELIRQHGFVAKKKFGQNFLIDNNIIEKIIAGANLQKNDRVLEIGPGFGALTGRLVATCGEGNLVCVEIDEALATVLAELYPGVRVIQGDILKMDLGDIVGAGGKVVANLPYYIATPIITKLLQSPMASLTIMVQKEVADRLRAEPGTKAYGSLTVFASFHAKIHHVTNVNPNCFWPKPNVESTVLHFEMGCYHNPKDRELFYGIVRQAFTTRRKTMINCLTAGGMQKGTLVSTLSKLGIKENVRAEELTLEQYVQLADALA